jgi:hypothetical protein
MAACAPNMRSSPRAAAAGKSTCAAWDVALSDRALRVARLHLDVRLRVPGRRLAEDEVVRLRLSVRDWFRLMEWVAETVAQPAGAGHVASSSTRRGDSPFESARHQDLRLCQLRILDMR